MSRGRLHEAEETAREALCLVTGPDGRPLPIAARAMSAMAELAYEWDRLDEALGYAGQSVELARLWGNADPLVSAYLTLADVLLALGRLDDARDALRDAERLSQDVTLFPATSSLLRASRALFWLKEGTLAPARQWSDKVTPDATGVTEMKQTLVLGQVHLVGAARRRPGCRRHATGGGTSAGTALVAHQRSDCEGAGVLRPRPQGAGADRAGGGPDAG